MNVESEFLNMLIYAKTHGYRGVALLPFCPMCGRKGDVVSLFSFIPADEGLYKIMNGYILFYSVCSKCLEKYDVDEIGEYVNNHIRELLSKSSKVEV